MAVPRERVQLEVVRAHVVRARDGVGAAAAVAVQVGLALDVEPLALHELGLCIERGRVGADGRFAVRLPAGDRIPRRNWAVDAVLDHRAVLLLEGVVRRWRAPVLVRARLVVGAPAVPDVDADVARVEGRGHAERGQARRAPDGRDERPRGRTRALGAAGVAVEVATRDARRQVGAAHLDVVARLGHESLPRKLELAVPAIGPTHVLDVRDAAALRARGVRRAVGHPIARVHAVRPHGQELLAQLAVGRERVDLGLPVAAVVLLARRQRVVPATLDVVERHPRMRRLVAGEAAHGVVGAVLDEALVELEHELIRARLALDDQLLVALDEQLAAQHLGRRGRCR